MRKTIICILVLFSAFAAVVLPPIVTRASSVNGSNEVTTQVFGFKSVRHSTVYLTNEQYDSLQRFLVEFHGKLNCTKTKEDAIPLFRSAILHLDSYGLLPKGMNANLVTNDSLAISRWNALCLVAGYTDRTIMGGLLSGLFFPFLIRNAFPLQLASVIYLGCYSDWSWVDHGPASGWVVSCGLNFVQFWEQGMYGDFPLMISTGVQSFPAGIIGFTGINVRFSQMNHFFVGSALGVKIKAA
jgi:hypothetical protein